MITLIAAMDEKKLIGKDGWMPWNNKEDLQHFREYTLNKVMLVGRKTFEGFKKPLPHRFHYVLTHSDMVYPYESVRVIHDIHEVIDCYKESEEELVVIGGAQVYREALPYADRLVLSIMEGEYEGDTYFPDFDENEFEVVQRISKDSFSIRILERKDNL